MDYAICYKSGNLIAWPQVLRGRKNAAVKLRALDDDRLCIVPWPDPVR